MTDNPPPYHDWTSVPDTALLPPPPPAPSDYSTGTNATYDEAAAAHKWCTLYPVYGPEVPSQSILNATQGGRHDIEAPKTSRSVIRRTPATPNTATKYLITVPRARHDSDQTLLTRLPLYFAAFHNPLLPNPGFSPRPPYTVFFTITPIKFVTKDSIVSLGFASKPYPPNRQPGWHRASIGVHSDDGRRYVNDSWGGIDFTSPFKQNETVGIGMKFYPGEPAVAAQRGAIAQASLRQKVGEMSSYREVSSRLPRCKVKAFLIRDGKLEGQWDIDEERDAEHDEGVAGLMGESDLYAAIGLCGPAEVEVEFYTEAEQQVRGQLLPADIMKQAA